MADVNSRMNYGSDVIVNQPGVSQGISNIPTPALPSGAAVENRNGLTFEEMALRMQTSSPGANFVPGSSIDTTGRYKYVFPYGDHEEGAAQYQSTLDRWGNGLAKFAGTTLTTAVVGTVGTIYGMGQYALTGRFASLYDNPVNRKLDEINKDMEKWLPNYYSHAETDAAWYSPKNILTANFWSDKVLKNLGFTAGTILGGFGWGAMFKAIGLTAKLTAAGANMMKVAQTVDDVIASAPKAAAFGNVGRAIEELSRKTLTGTLGKILSNADRTIVSTMGSLGEASIEALQNVNEFRKKLIDEYIAVNGTAPTPEELEEINQYSDKVGNFTWGMNVALLSATNYIQLPKILTTSRVADKMGMNTIVKESVEKGATTAEKVAAKHITGKPFLEKALGKPGRILDKYIVKPGKLLVSPIEGFEEFSQYSIQKGTDAFFDQAYDVNEDVTSFWSNLQETIGSVLDDGVRETLSSKDGMESMLIGAISGGIQTSFSPFGQNTVKERGFFGDGGIRGANTKAAIKALDATNLNKVLKDAVSYINIGINAQKNRQGAVLNEDVLSEKNFEADYALSYILPRVKYGKVDGIKQELGLYREQAMSESGFAELKAEGYVLENESRENFLARLNKIEKTADEVNDVYQKLSQKYSAQLNEKGERIYSDDVIERLTYAVSKVRDYDTRLEELNLKIAGFTNPLDIRKAVEESEGWKNNDLRAIADDKNLETVIEKAKADVATKVPLENDELKNSIVDFAEMLILRQNFINEYQTIKEKPNEIKDKSTSPISEKVELTEEEKSKYPNKTITVTTKSGERQIQTNTEYLLGKRIKQDKNGEPVFSAPVIIILDENEDKSLKIKDNKGNIRDISREELQPYTLTKVENLAKNRKAKYVYDHWNTIFEHWGIKDKNGKPVRGRIEYSNDTNRVNFVWTDEEGVEHRNYAYNRDFVPQGSFKEAKIRDIGTRTAVQEASLAAFVSEKETLSDKIALRNEMISSLYDESTKKLDAVTNKLNTNKVKLERSKESLEKAIEDLDSLTKRKSRAVKKRAAIERSIKDLSELYDVLTEENQRLEQEKLSLESMIPFFKEYIEDMEDLPEDTTEIIKQLKKDLENINSLIDVDNDIIKQNKDLLSQIEEVISTSLAVIRDFIDDFKRLNPNAPLTIDELEDILEEKLGKEGAKQIIQERLGFAGLILDFEEELRSLEESLQVPELSKKADKVREELEMATESLNYSLGLYDTKKALLDKFEEFIEIQKQKEEEENKLQKNEAFKSGILGTLGTHVQNLFATKFYEPSAKKSETDVVKGTMPIDDGKPHQKRANNFGFRYHEMDNKDKLKGVVVTKRTEGNLIPGLTAHLMKDATAKQKEKYKEEEIIALVIVQLNDDGTYSLVDEKGQLLKEGANALEEAIYQTFPMEDLKATYKDKDGDDVYETMFREGTDEDTVNFLTKQYAAWRKRQLDPNKTELSDPEDIKVSFGIVEYVEYLDSDGKTKRDYEARTTVEEAGLIQPDELETGPRITIAVSNESISEGSVTFTTPKGRPFLRMPGKGLAKLFNRKFTEREANAIFDVILQVAKNGVKKGEVSTETMDLINWLKTVVYWGISKNLQTDERKEPGYNNIWFENVKEGKEKVLRLFMSGLTTDSKQAFLFTPTALKENKHLIVSLLQDMYHNTFATNVNEKQWNAPYFEIVGIKEDGTPEYREWKNYQTYLLSAKNPDGSKRQKEEIPLVTQFKPLKNKEEDTNRKAIYFSLDSVTTEYDIPKKQPKKKAEKEAPKTEKVEEKKNVTTHKLDGTKETWHFTSFGGFDISFSFDPKVFNETKGKKGYWLHVSSKAISSIVKAGKATDSKSALDYIAPILLKHITNEYDARNKKEEVKPVKTHKFDGSKEVWHFTSFGGFDVSFSFNPQVFYSTNGEKGFWLELPAETVGAIITAGQAMDAESALNFIAPRLLKNITNEYQATLVPDNPPINVEEKDIKEEKKEEVPPAQPTLNQSIEPTQEEVKNNPTPVPSEKDWMNNSISALAQYEDPSYADWGKTSAFPDRGTIMDALTQSTKIPQEIKSRLLSEGSAIYRGLTEIPTNTPSGTKSTPQEGIDWNTATVDSLKKDLIEGKIKNITSEGEEPGITVTFNGYQEEDRTYERMVAVQEGFPEVDVIEEPKGNYFGVDDFFAQMKVSYHENDKSLDKAIQSIIDYNKSLLIKTPASPVETSVPKEDIIRMDDDSVPPIGEHHTEARLMVNSPNLEPENWKEIEAWIIENFPWIPIYRVKNIIRSTNGKQLWGMLQDAAIYLHENAQRGTIYHEIFEAVWKMCATPEEKAKIIRDFRRTKGSFTNRFSPTHEKIKYSEATAQQIKEEIAEEHRDWVLYKKEPYREVGGNFIVKFFREIANFFREFFTGEKAKSNTQKLFEKMGSGYYAKYSPYESRLAFAKKGFIDIEDVTVGEFAEARLDTVSVAHEYEVIQHMTFSLLSKITGTNQSLFKIEDIDKTSFYNDIKLEILGLIKGKVQALRGLIASGQLSEQKIKTAESDVNNLTHLFTDIQIEWKNLIMQHVEFLRTYGIDFDENDVLELTDENKVKEDPYGNPRKIDSFRKANKAIKVLLASLAYSEIKTKATLTTEREVIASPTYIGGVRLLPADQVHLDLLNNLHMSVNLPDMMNKLRALAIKNPNYEALYKRLTKQSTAHAFNYSILEEHDWQLLSSFWKSMKLQNADTITIFILPDGEPIITDSAMNSATKQAKYEMFNSMVDRIKDGNAFFTYNKNKGTYTANKALKDYRFSAGQIEGYTEFLKELGIVFDPKVIKKLKPNQLNNFRTAVEYIQSTFSNFGPKYNRAGNPIDEDGNELVQVIDGVKVSINEKPQHDTSLFFLTSTTLDIEGRLMQLAAIKASIENPEYQSVYFNMNGDQTQTYIGTNILSDFYDVISSISNINDLNNEEKGLTKFKYLLTDVFSEGSVILNRMFMMDSNGKKREGSENIMKQILVDGIIDEQKGRKVESEKTTKRQRLTMEMNLNSEGVYFPLVPGDATLEYAVRLHDEGDPFVTSQMISTKSYLNIFRDYFISEVKVSRENRKTVDEDKRRDLRFFKAILNNDKLHDEIVSDSNRELYPDPIGLYEAYKSEINKAIEKFIETKAEDKFELLKEYNLVVSTSEGYSVENLNIMGQLDVNEQNIRAKLKQMTINYIIANIEIHKLIFSDPYRYSDELKRVKNALSPRQSLLNLNQTARNIYHKVRNKGRKKGDIGYSDYERNHLRAVIIDDLFYTNKNKGYDKAYEGTDGGGIMTLSAMRKIRDLEGTWTDDNERQYKYEIAYEKYHKGIELSPEEKKIYDPAKKGRDNPNIPDTFVNKKPIGTGSMDNGRETNDFYVHKFALCVYSYRILHEINPNSTALRLYNKMQAEEIDYAVFKSAVKGGMESVFEPYINGKFNEAPFETKAQAKNPSIPQGVIKIPYSTFAIQSEVPSKSEPVVRQGSQPTKLATLDLMEAGMPIDFRPDEDFNERLEEWLSLSDEKKRERSDLYKEILTNKKLLEVKIEEEFKALLKRLGIVSTKEGYKLENKAKLIKSLKDEIFKRDINRNIKQAFDEFEKDKVVLEATSAYKQIRNILYSFANDNITRPRLTGASKVQISSAFLESIQATPVDSKTKKGKKVKAYETELLNFYEDEDGKRVCEIMISRWFKSNKSDEELLEYFNKTEEGRKILQGIAFRIPTQKQNSIDVFRIAKFLPETYVDSVVIPAALTKKTGSDFDIDKLYMYLKNVFEDADGDIKLIPFYGTTEKAKSMLRDFIAKDFEKRIPKIQEKLEKNERLQSIFGGMALGRVPKKVYEKWVPIFKRWYSDKLVDNKLPVEVIEEFFMSRVEKLNKQLSDLTDDDIREGMIDDRFEEWYLLSIENAYVQSLENLISHPMNYKRLVLPNSADDMVTLSDRITEKLGFKVTDYTNPGNMLDHRYMMELRYAFISGKYSIGIAAVAQTNNALNQGSIIYYDSDKAISENTSLQDQLILGAFPNSGTYATNTDINFKHYNTVKVKGKRLPTLSLVMDKLKLNYISDVIGQFIDGFVDISKDPWIIRLGVHQNVVGTWLYLIKIGVPIETVAYFMNQPIIRNYLKSLDNVGYKWLFIEDHIIDQLDEFASKAEAPTEIADDTELYKMIGMSPEEMTQEQLAQQQFILKEFLKYAKMGEHLFHLTQGTNFDTANLNDPLLVFKKMIQFKKAQKTIFSSFNDENEVRSAADILMQRTFIGVLKETMKEIREAFATILVSDSLKSNGKVSAREVLEAVLLPYVDLNDREFVKIAQKAVYDLFDWAMQIDKNAGKSITSVLLGKNAADGKRVPSYSKEIIDFRDSIIGNESKKLVGQPNHPLYNNLIIKSLRLTPGSKEGKPDNLSLVGRDNKVYNQDLIIGAFEELRKYLTESGKNDLYRKLVAVAIMQSGLKMSTVSFSQLLPYDDFKEIYNEALFKLSDMPNLADFHTAHVFERTNWNNSNIVDTYFDQARKSNKPNRYEVYSYYHIGKDLIKKSLKTAIGLHKIPMVVELPINSKAGKHDFIIYTWADKLSKKKLIAAKKSGSTAHIHRVLMKKVYYENEDGDLVPKIDETKKKNKEGKEITYYKYVFKAINAHGDSFRAQEFLPKIDPSNADSTLMKPSAIDNGFIKVEEVIKKYGDREILVSSGEVEDETIMYYLENEQKEEKTEKSTGKKMSIKLPNGAIYETTDPDPEYLSKNGMSDEEIGEILDEYCKG